MFRTVVVLTCLWLVSCGGPAGEGEPIEFGTSLRAFRPAECSVAVDEAIHRAVDTYNIPRWFYYALVHRESTFDPLAVNDSVPGEIGLGLTQLTNADHHGWPYPMFLPAPDNNHQQWRWDMGLNNPSFGPWIDMNDISALPTEDSWQDPDLNLDRFSSGYAAPAYFLFASKYGLSDPVEIWKRVAFHWNQGLFSTYDPNHWYMPQYNQYVNNYKPQVDAEDGAWSGPPAVPPYTGGASDPFQSNASPIPACLAAGASTAITGTFTNDGPALAGTFVDIEVFTAAHANVGQQYWSNQSFSSGQTRQFIYNWTAPATPGTYLAELGVFDSAWDQIHWHSSAASIQVHAPDAARYNFECSTHAYTDDNAGVTLAASSVQKFQGSSSLAVNFSGATGVPDVFTAPAVSPGPGTVLTYRVWVPAGSNLTSVQPYIKQNAAGGWAWTGTYRSIGTLSAGAWNTITVTVPAGAAPLSEIGVEFTLSGAWTGAAYIDSITW